MNNLDACEFNSLWILENLPDSSAMRRKLLQNILAITAAGHPIRRKAHEMLAALDIFDAHQKSLPFSTAEKGDGK